MKKVLVIMGATGTGKTALAMRVSDVIPSQIISIDSAMVYQGMDIGTAKPNLLELERYPHELVNIISPVESYSVADCITMVPDLIAKAHKVGRLPILVGGTMMYHFMLQNGIHSFPSIPQAVRLQLQLEFREHGLTWQWQKLFDLDPLYAEKIVPTDQQRIHRGLELLMIGVVPSEILLKPKPVSVLAGYELINVCLEFLPRSDLYQRLDSRFDQMVANGFIDEVDVLLRKFPQIYDCASFRSIGYKHIAQYIQGYIPKDQALDQAKTATRRFAKRQITWASRWRDQAYFFDINSLSLTQVLEKLLERGL